MEGEEKLCHLRIGGDLKKDETRVLSGVVYMTKAEGRELSLGGHHRGKYVGRRNHYCI